MPAIPTNKTAEISVARLPERQVPLKLAASGPNTRLKPKTRNTKILGKLCPSCGVPGLVFCETQMRIIYECGNGHQYETKKRLDEISAG